MRECACAFVSVFVYACVRVRCARAYGRAAVAGQGEAAGPCELARVVASGFVWVCVRVSSRARTRARARVCLRV